MSEKRFVLYEHKENYYILENPRLDLDFIEMLGDALTDEEIVKKLNQLDDKVIELAEENENLRQFVNKGRRLSVKELMDNVNENESLKKKIKRLKKENEKLKKRFTDDAYHYDRWIKQIKNYVDNEEFEYNEESIIKLCLSYTLQSLRNGENLKRFQWDNIK